MAAISNSIVLARNSSVQHPLDSSFKSANQSLGILCPTKVSVSTLRSAKSGRRPLTVQASYREDGRPSNASIFIGGFALGGLIVGALGCVYAPQISKALTGDDRKELMKKLPKFIYDEEKALEKTRKVLTDKIAQLNSAIDDISTQIHPDSSPNGSAASSDEVEAAV